MPRNWAIQNFFRQCVYDYEQKVLEIKQSQTRDNQFFYLKLLLNNFYMHSKPKIDKKEAKLKFSAKAIITEPSSEKNNRVSFEGNGKRND